MTATDATDPLDPRPRPDDTCAWCGIRATAVPDEPPIYFLAAWYHRRGCYPSARLLAGGYLPADHKAWVVP